MKHFPHLLIATLLLTLLTSTAATSFADEAAKEAETSEQTVTKDVADKSDSKAADQSADEQSAKDDSEKSQVEEKKPVKVRMAHIKLDGEMPETPGQMSLFGDIGIDLRKTIARIDKVAEDKRVRGLVLQIESTALPLGKLNELRAAIGRVQQSGKKVVAQLETSMGSQLLLATACDEVMMPEAGYVLLPGVRMELTYYKDLLEKLGIEADMLHMGDCKGAAEPLTRRNMSEPVRKNLTAFVDDVYDQMLTTLAADRDLQIEEVRAIVDRGLMTASQAKEAGLIDHLVYPDEFREHLQEQFEADELVYLLNYAKKEIDTDFSGPMGMMKLLQAIMGSGSKGGRDSGPKLALVYAVGPITSGKSASGLLGDQSMGSETIVKALRDAAEDKSVKAIVLRINSPGGSAVASDMIWRATQAIDIPIVASMGDVAASGGYYIAMGADRILAEPGTITGSIGVVGGKLSMSGLYEKIGVTTDVIQRGANGAIFSATNKFTDEEREVFGEMMSDIYRLFTSKAAEGRGMSVEDLEKLAGGQIYTGRIAKRKGLIDEVGTLTDAFRLAKDLAGLDVDEKYPLVVLPEARNPFEELFGASLDAEREGRIATGLLQLMPEIAGPMQHALVLRDLLREPAVLIMPYHLRLQ